MSDEPSKQKSTHRILKYSGMVVQMAALLVIAVYLGKKIDAYFGNEKPYIMLMLLVLSLIAYLYKMIKDLSSDKG